MTRQIVQLVAGTLGLWAGLAAVAWLLAGDVALLHTAVACALCLLPNVATMLWCHYAFGGSPEQQLGAVMGGTGIRLVIAVGGGIALSRSVAVFAAPSFLIWVIVFYLATLALEIVLVVRRQTARADELAAQAHPPQS